MDEDVIRIPLRAKDGSARAWAIVDRDDADLALRKWHFHKKGYAQSYADRKKHFMHALILSRSIGRSLRPNEVTDHVNGKKLDNRRVNLRPSTKSQNAANCNSRQGSSSAFLGVFKRATKWEAGITVDGKSIYLGRFATEAEAALAYNRAAIVHHGDFARLNVVEVDG